MNNSMTLWQPDSGNTVPKKADKPTVIAGYAAQLTERDRSQVVSAFEAGHYEMGLNFLWLRTISALKRVLATVGLGLLGEMLGKVGVDEDDDLEDLLSARDAIRLAEELGAVTTTEALRLRHTYEIVTHFNQLAIDEASVDEIDVSEAIASMKACVNAVLSKPKIEVAKKFVEFREGLESGFFGSDEEKLNVLMSSPYFFWKLTIGILMNSAKDATGVKLEHCLANANVLLPKLWPKLRDPEKWQVGRTYAEVYSEGKKTSVSGLKRALMTVRGFDFVPENLRSDTFIRTAQAIIRAHDGMNNFYNEGAPTRSLAQLGTSIPAPAVPASMTALLAVYLGNQYGVSWEAAPVSSSMLSELSMDRWRYYLDEVLPTDVRTLHKIGSLAQPRRRWMEVVETYRLRDLQLREREVSRLITSSANKMEKDVETAANRLLFKYYGKKGKGII